MLNIVMSKTVMDDSVSLIPLPGMSLECVRKPSQLQEEHLNSTHKRPRPQHLGIESMPLLLC